MIDDAMQPIVAQLAKHGPLPSAAERDLAKVRQVQTLLMQIDQPISDDDARVLVKLFGPDDSFGLAWTLIHLIETAPGWPLWDVFVETGNEWIELLKQRARS